MFIIRGNELEPQSVVLLFVIFGMMRCLVGNQGFCWVLLNKIFGMFFHIWFHGVGASPNEENFVEVYEDEND